MQLRRQEIKKNKKIVQGDSWEKRGKLKKNNPSTVQTQIYDLPFALTWTHCIQYK